MKVLFDCRWIGGHGIGRFSEEIASRLSHYPLPVVGKPMSAFDSIRLSFYGFKQGQWLFSPGYNAPLFGRVPYFITVHDINHIDRPENGGILKKIYYLLILKRLCHRARAVMTVSEFSKCRIVEWSGMDAGKVFNVGNGVSKYFCSDGNRHEIDGGYLLCVSNRKGHKNENGLLYAFAQAKLPAHLKLVLTGESNQALIELASKLGITDRLLFTGRVSEEELAALYRGAVFLVFPSLYEGFGLPIVEAFASGTPVITSNVTSMPEIAGDAALLVDPHDIADIAAAMERLYDSPSLRAELAARGLERAKQFTWDAVVERIKMAVKAVDTDPAYPLTWG